MGMTTQQFTVSRSAATSAYALLKTFASRPMTEALAQEIIQEIDRACLESIASYGGLREYLDVRDGDVVHYALRLHFEDRSLVAVIADEVRRHFRSGENGKVVVALITYASAHRNVLDGHWKSMDGGSIFPSSPKPLVAPVTGLEEEAEVVQHAAEVAEWKTSRAEADVAFGPPASPKALWEARVQAGEVDTAPGWLARVPSPAKPLRGQRRGGSTSDRDAFVLKLLAGNPKIPTMGPGGIHERVKAQFGVGMREGHVGVLRAKAQQIARSAPLLDSQEVFEIASQNTLRSGSDAVDRLRAAVIARRAAFVVHMDAMTRFEVAEEESKAAKQTYDDADSLVYRLVDALDA